MRAAAGEDTPVFPTALAASRLPPPPAGATGVVHAAFAVGSAPAADAYLARLILGTTPIVDRVHRAAGGDGDSRIVSVADVAGRAVFGATLGPHVDVGGGATFGDDAFPAGPGGTRTIIGAEDDLAVSVVTP